MLVIAVTGGIGSGKTTATEYLKSRGAAVLDLDKVAHGLLQPGRTSYDEIIETFGPVVLDASGRIDRAALASAAFVSKVSCEHLNRIMHPAVAREVLEQLEGFRSAPTAPQVVVLEVPLLVEAPAFAQAADVVLAVSAQEDLRIARCVAFGRDEADARARVACQATDADREALADRTIVNEGSMQQFIDELDRFWEEVVEPRAA